MAQKRFSKKTIMIIAALITGVAAICAAVIMILPDIGLPGGENNLAIRVADDQNNPVAGAMVLLFSDDGAIKQYTDTIGSVVFVEASKLKNFQLVVEAPGYEIYDQQFPGRAENKTDVRLKDKQGSRAGVIFRVTDQGTGQPIDRAELQVIVGSDLLTQGTDSNGITKFDLDFPPSGKVDAMLIANTQDYEVRNENITLYPNRIQDVLLSKEQNSLEVTSVQATSQPAPSSEKMEQGDKPEVTTKGVMIRAQTSSRVNQSLGFEVQQEPTQSENENGVLRIMMVSPLDEPIAGVNTTVFTQKTDVNNQPLQDQYVANAGSDAGGIASMQLKPNKYAVLPEIAGYPWSSLIYDHEIKQNQLTTLLIVPSQLSITIHRADKSLLKDNYVVVSTQKLDANGDPVPDQRIREGRIDTTGVLLFTLTPGRYAVYIDGLRGEDWGSIDHDLPPATRVNLDIWLGRIRVEGRNAEGRIQEGFYSRVHSERQDADGNPIPGDGIAEARTDASGISNYDLTPGTYFVVSDLGQAKVELKAGETVVVNNEDFEQP